MASSRTPVPLAPPALPRLSAPPLQPRHARRAGLVGRWGLGVLVLMAAACGAGGFLVLTHGGREVRADIRLHPGLERLVRFSGLGLDEVHLTGHAFTADSEIFDALDLANVRSLVWIDTAAVRARIERLPWVATAALTRVYPGTLQIQITERKPFAVWRRGPSEYLIDRTGRVLSAVRAGSITDLPIAAGEGANIELAALMSLLDRFPALRQKLERAEWVGERRWTLHLAANVTLHLPTDREAASLTELASRGAIETVLATPNRTIDMRGHGRLTIRDTAGARHSGRLPDPGT